MTRPSAITRRAALLTLASAAVAGRPLRAWQQSRAERGKRVIDEALAAVGGKAYLGMMDRIEYGRAYSFYREELRGLTRAKIYTRYLTRPEPPAPDFIGLRERQNFGKNEDSGVLFNEQGGWEINFRGARPLPDQRLASYRDSTQRNIFYLLRQRLGEPGLTFEWRESDIFDNRPVEIVEIADGANRTVTVYFSQSSRLPVRQLFQRRNPVTKDRDDEVTLFSKYRDVGGGVQWPMQILRERNGEKIFELFSESVTVNQDLKDDLFTLAANQKILPKAK
jgi:hypothetical protein